MFGTSEQTAEGSPFVLGRRGGRSVRGAQEHHVFAEGAGRNLGEADCPLQGFEPCSARSRARETERYQSLGRLTLSEQEQLAGHGLTQQSRQSPGRVPGRTQAHAGLTQGEARRRPREAYVAGKSQLGASSQRGAVEHSDREGGQRGQGGERGAAGIEHGLRAFGSFGQRADLAQIASRREARTDGGNDGHAHARVDRDRVARHLERTQGREVERVVRRRAIELELDARALVVMLDPE